ncbi:MAG: thioredoxin-disulfide reductase [Eubacteriales bacterium]|nr:thioredoxin-disulfide reductase [Eubacteriales bacterium]
MYDTIIIGSGPAGLTAAIYAQRAQLHAVVVEREYMGTGQIAQSEQVDNYPGLPGINGYDLGEKLREHAESLGTTFVEGEGMRLHPEGTQWTLTLTDGTALEGKTIIYAAGASHRKLDIPGEEEFTGRGVSYCAVCDGAFYHGRTVVVIGGGDTALGDALLLSRIADTVYLVHRRAEFRANPTIQKRVREAPNIQLVTNAVPEEIQGKDSVTGVRILQQGTERILKADGVFVAVGIRPNTGLLQGVAKLDAQGYICAGEDGITSAPGLFAAGDARAKPLRQVVTAVADGANCVTAAQEYLDRQNG